MVEGINAQFSFADFRIPNFAYNASTDPDVPIKIEFAPRGDYYQNEGTFFLHILFSGIEDKENGKKIIEVNAVGVFTFEKGLAFKDIPSFFYKNAIAIFFPYLRSFVSTLTLQSNSPLLLLSLMNLSNLEEPLIKNTTCFDVEPL